MKLNITQSLVKRIKTQTKDFLKTLGSVLAYSFVDEMKYVMLKEK